MRLTPRAGRGEEVRLLQAQEGCRGGTGQDGAIIRAGKANARYTTPPFAHEHQQNSFSFYQRLMCRVIILVFVCNKGSRPETVEIGNTVRVKEKLYRHGIIKGVYGKNVNEGVRNGVLVC